MADLPDFDPYQVLGVEKASDAGVIKKAYRKLALLKHPDKCGGDDELKKLRTDEFQRLNEAYDILGDEEKRQRHDALVRLDALRKEKASFARGGAPRPPMRSSTFSTAYPGATGANYTTRGPANFEERAPKFYDEDDLYTRRTGPNDDYYSRRSAEKQARPDRARAATERDSEEKRRVERRREAEERRRQEEIRASRARKTEFNEERTRSSSWEEEKRRRDGEERSRRGYEDPLRSKYSEMEETAQQYTGTSFAEPRPGMSRRSSTREVPRPYMATRRSRASPKERPNPDDALRELEREKQRLAELREKEREKERLKSERAVRAQQAERERVEAERKTREAERKAREEERFERYERERAREKEAKRLQREREEQERERITRSQREKTSKRDYPSIRQQKEYIEPYEKRPPGLQHHNTSPPVLPSDSTERPPARTKTEPVKVTSTYPPTHPALGRATTMPVSSSSSSRRSAVAPSKLRESTTLQDSGYSSSGTAASTSERPRTASKSKVKTYSYPADDDKVAVEQPYSYRTTTRKPEARESAPTPFAATIAGLASAYTNRSRPSTSSGPDKVRPEMPHSYSSRTVPRAVSPDRAPRRERGRDRDRDRLYAERPSMPATSSYGEPSYSRYEDPIYTRPTTSRRAEPDLYRQGYPRAGMVQS